MSAIENRSNDTLVCGTSENDSIWTSADNYNVTIFASSGDDTIQINSVRVSVNSGDGNDSVDVYSWSNGVTVNPGLGNDTVSTHLTNDSCKVIVQYADGDGNDVITGFGTDDTLEIVSGTFSTTKSGKDLIVNIGSGSVILKDSADITGVKIGKSQKSVETYFVNKYNSTVITGSSFNDTVFNYGSNIIINTAEGNDEIVSFAEDSWGNSNSYHGYVTINSGMGSDLISAFGCLTYVNSGEGNDSIYSSGKNNTIIADAGDDSIKNYGSYSVLFAGDGNDYIDSLSYSTINGGIGNDIVTLCNASHNNLITYTYGDGHDSIYNFDADDTLQVTGISNFSTVRNGGDLRIIFNNGSISLVNVGAGVGIANFVGFPEIMAVDPPVDICPPSHTIPSPSHGETTQGSGGDTIINGPTTIINIGGGDVIIDNSSHTTIVGVTVNHTTNTMTITNEYNQNNVWLNQNNDYSNVINIDGSKVKGAKYFVGNGNSNSIKASAGGSTLYGGGQGNNTLVGGSGRDFFQYSGGGYDTAKNFTAGRDANSDVLYFSSAVTSIRRESSSMYFDSADGTRMQVQNSSSINEAIQYTTDGKNISLAKVGYAEQNNSFTYEDGVNFYSGGNHTDVLNVTNYQGKNIWLDGSAGVGYSGINNINAAQSSGNNTLAGDGGNNQIAAGKGNDSLWGGSGSSEDVLIGGSGQDMF